MGGPPPIDPRRANYAKFPATYDFVVNLVVTLLFIGQLTTLGNALGLPIRIDRVLPAAIGLLLITLGNVLPRARPNWFFGIRTPWTLTNDRVWERTHRVGGYLMMAAGVATIAAAFVTASAMRLVLLLSVVISGVSSVIYSYFAWKQETSR
jgi:uncharacterized membrane protein